jgi:hypothetical protein
LRPTPEARGPRGRYGRRSEPPTADRFRIAAVGRRCPDTGRTVGVIARREHLVDGSATPCEPPTATRGAFNPFLPRSGRACRRANGANGGPGL